MFGDIDLNDRAGDDVIRELFGEWQAAMQPPGGWPEDNDGSDRAADRVSEVRNRIFAAPASGTVGLAIKAYLAACEQIGSSNTDPCALSVRRTETGWLIGADLKGLVADAARFAPELEPLVAAFIAAPDGLHEAAGDDATGEETGDEEKRESVGRANWTAAREWLVARFGTDPWEPRELQLPFVVDRKAPDCRRRLTVSFRSASGTCPAPATMASISKSATISVHSISAASISDSVMTAARSRRRYNGSLPTCPAN